MSMSEQQLIIVRIPGTDSPVYNIDPYIMEKKKSKTRMAQRLSPSEKNSAPLSSNVSRSYLNFCPC